MGKRWSVDFTLDGNRTLGGIDPTRVLNPLQPVASGGFVGDGSRITENFTAVTAGATYRGTHWSASARAERRGGDAGDRNGLTAAALRQVGEGSALGGAFDWHVAEADGGLRTRTAGIAASWAHRAAGSRWSWLEKLELRDDSVADAVAGFAGPIGGAALLVSGNARSRQVVNSYYPATASAARGATTLALGASTGARQAIAAGDLLLVIQMQDAGVDTTNGTTYGNGATGGGYTDVRGAGRYEYVRAGNAVAATGGTPTLVGGAGAGLVDAYANAPSATTTARASFQVVVVPRYNNLSVTGTVAATPWNGTSGGIVALDVAQHLTFAGGNVSVSGAGFRGGGARQQAGGAGANTDYRTLASIAANGAKGGGIAGTPRYVSSAGALLDTGVEGYVGGSNGRGAPGNAGGGGTDGNPAANDQN